MIINHNNDLSFALDATAAAFAFEKADRVVGLLPVHVKESIPVSLEKYSQQYHLTVHLPFVIKGDTAWKAYERLAHDPEHGFHLWIDPSDGETLYCAPLREATATELDLALSAAASCLDACWNDLSFFNKMANDDEGGETRSHASDEADDEDGFHPFESLIDLIGL